MKNTKKKLNGQSKIVKASFSGSNIAKYSGLNTVAKYMKCNKVWYQPDFDGNHVVVYQWNKPDLQNSYI